MPPAVLAVADHTGWAYVTAVSAVDGRPSVVARRRIALIGPGLPTQPYEHDTRGMRPGDAEALLARVRASIAATTDLALERIVGDLEPEHRVTTLVIRTPPFDALPPSVADVHASYALLCAADGMLFQMAVCAAASRFGLGVVTMKRGTEIASAAAALGVSPAAVEDFVGGAGRPKGSPWTAEHRRSYAAAVTVLAGKVRGLTIRDAVD
jgi:hypothetical protein